MGLLFLHQEHGVVSLGVERVGGDDSFSQVQVCQQRLEAGDLIGFPSTSTWASTALASWSATASRCAACPSALAWRVPRTALPSTASARRQREPRLRFLPAAASRAVSHDPTAASSAAASTVSSTRRMVASPGGWNTPASGS